MPAKYRGLTSAQAGKRLEQDGPNVLPERPPPSSFQLALRQLKNPFVYVLLGAGVLTLFLDHLSDAVIIFVAILINSVLGFVQEKRAGNALEALKKYVEDDVVVYRDAKQTTIPTKTLVLGDLVILHPGDKVPADGKLVEANRLSVAESVLTGEAHPVFKKVGESVHMGTTVIAGKAIVEVEKTGVETTFGKISASVQEHQEDTPLKKQLAKFARQLSIIVLVLTATVFVVGLVAQREPVELFTTSIALAVSAIPEGLLIAFTVILAIGMQRIVRRKGLVRNLLSAETLGGVTTICIDKTGTLTKGEMTVVKVVGDETKLARQILLSNDMDDPLTISSLAWAKSKIKGFDLKLKELKRLDYLPFSSKRRFFACLNRHDSRSNRLYVQGAPDFVLEWCRVDANRKREIVSEIEKLTNEGKRLVGLAEKKVTHNKEQITIKDSHTNLEWVGLIAFSDPERAGVESALKKTRDAGVRLIVITGDYARTALHVTRAVGLEIDESNTLLGSELAKMTPDDLRDLLRNENKKPMLFARTTPEQKLKIVDALKANGEVVAMMGDGVNDAPALAKADIGIVVGGATDVAKEAADLVLVDSSFETIVAAIEEGRGIFNNLRKVILYLMSDAFSEITTVLGTLIVALPLPVTAAQILWINIVSDGFPHLALTVDQKAADIMQADPKGFGHEIVSKWMKVLIIIVSVVSGLVAFSLFVYYWKSTGNLKLAQSVAFMSLGVNSLLYVFSVRALTTPLWKTNPFSNKWLNYAVVAGFVLQLVPFLTVPTRNFFGTLPLEASWFYSVLVSSLLVVALIEIMKWMIRRAKWRIY